MYFKTYHDEFTKKKSRLKIYFCRLKLVVYPSCKYLWILHQIVFFLKYLLIIKYILLAFAYIIHKCVCSFLVKMMFMFVNLEQIGFDQTIICLQVEKQVYLEHCFRNSTKLFHFLTSWNGEGKFKLKQLPNCFYRLKASLHQKKKKKAFASQEN